MAVDWNYYNQFTELIDLYMPVSGEGDTIATQLVTAVNKLVYKWYNDGDVYDNTFGLKGWCNDLSDYANWIYKYIGFYDSILDSIQDCATDGDYEDLLQNLADSVFDEELLRALNKMEKRGTIYQCNGPFEFREPEDDEDDEDEWY